MPTAKPTQIIVHRLELQATERKFLEEYIESRKNPKVTTGDIQQALLKNSGTIFFTVVAGSVVGALGYYGYKAYLDVQEALMSLNPVETIKELKKSVPSMKNTISTVRQKKSWIEDGKPMIDNADGTQSPKLRPKEDVSLGDLYMIGFRNFWGMEQ